MGRERVEGEAVHDGGDRLWHGVDGELDSTIIYLAADESSYVNGAIVSCDGGWTCC